MRFLNDLIFAPVARFAGKGLLLFRGDLPLAFTTGCPSTKNN